MSPISAILLRCTHAIEPMCSGMGQNVENKFMRVNYLVYLSPIFLVCKATV